MRAADKGLWANNVLRSTAEPLPLARLMQVEDV